MCSAGENPVCCVVPSDEHPWPSSAQRHHCSLSPAVSPGVGQGLCPPGRLFACREAQGRSGEQRFCAQIGQGT